MSDQAVRTVNKQYIPCSQAVNETGLFTQHIIWERTKRRETEKHRETIYDRSLCSLLHSLLLEIDE